MILQRLSWNTKVILPLNNLPKKLAQDGRDWWKHWISSYDNVALSFEKACLDIKFFCKIILASFYLLYVYSMTAIFLKCGVTSTMLINKSINTLNSLSQY